MAVNISSLSLSSSLALVVLVHTKFLTHDDHDVVEVFLDVARLVLDGDIVESFILALHVLEQHLKSVTIQHERGMRSRHILRDRGNVLYLY